MLKKPCLNQRLAGHLVVAALELASHLGHLVDDAFDHLVSPLGHFSLADRAVFVGLEALKAEGVLLLIASAHVDRSIHHDFVAAGTFQKLLQPVGQGACLFYVLFLKTHLRYVSCFFFTLKKMELSYKTVKRG